ncbi:major facilitator superfamily protein-5 [Coleophoma cylindrospora]|uniref:Major facilitator superfamily protein-5 n=1 Tax=Coleophoma cylindrospora TaxID=1849047 RepID=A0A3D8RG59_9HELO|nr:major facilitator superfamily protein-5 [Coleophoma cylindrospora]
MAVADSVTPAAPISEAGDIEKLPESGHKDVGWDAYQTALLMDASERDAIALRVKHKLDAILMPLMCFIYFLSYLDKQALNYGNAYGLQTDLHMKGQDYSWVAAITNARYLVCAYPSTLLLQKLPIGKFVAGNLMLWGAILMLTTKANNFAGLMALRFVLGGAEACIGPAWLLLTSMFWTREEQPYRMSWWLGCNGLSSMVGAGISWGLGHTHGSLAPWQLVFLVIGVISFALGFVVFFIIPSSPLDAVFLTPEERIVAVWRVSRNQTGVKNPNLLWYQAVEAARDPKIYLFAVHAVSMGMLSSGTGNFFSVIIKGFGFDSLHTLLYQMPIGAIQFTATVLGGLFATMVPGTVLIVIIVGMLPSLAGMIGIASISSEHKWALLVCTWLQGVFGVSNILSWSVVMANVAGHTKRTTANGVWFVFYASGNIIGPFLFLTNEAPRYFTAIKTLCCMFGVCIFCAASLYVLLSWENRKRAAMGFLAEARDEDNFEDKTDMENKAFCYKL